MSLTCILKKGQQPIIITRANDLNIHSLAERKSSECVCLNGVCLNGLLFYVIDLHSQVGQQPIIITRANDLNIHSLAERKSNECVSAR
jgi:hypothetical protein